MMLCMLKFHIDLLSKSNKFHIDDSHFPHILYNDTYLLHMLSMWCIDDLKKMCMRKFRTETKCNSSMLNKFDWCYHYTHHLNKFLIRTFDTLRTVDWMMLCMLKFRIDLLSKQIDIYCRCYQFCSIHHNRTCKCWHCLLYKQFRWRRHHWNMNIHFVHIDDLKKMCTQKFRTETKSNSSRQNKFDLYYHYTHQLYKFLLHTFDKLSTDDSTRMCMLKFHIDLLSKSNKFYIDDLKSRYNEMTRMFLLHN